MILKNGLLINPLDPRANSGSGKTVQKGQEQTQEQTLDIRLADGVITEIGKNLGSATDETVFDASGLWIAPGFVDIHTHLRDFEQSESEDIETGTKAAAAGGYTTVLAMANTQPVVDNAMVLRRLLQMIEEMACIRVLPVAAVTKDLKGSQLTNMVELAEIGAAAFSDDGQPVTNLAVLRRALQNARLANRVIISHPEDKDLAACGAINESATAARLGLPSIPPASESASVAREIEVVRSVGARLHFAHISTAASVDLIRSAKRQGLPVTADVTPHHLQLCDADIKDFDANYKMNPPLRSQADQQALVAGIVDGTIDAIATDHAPHSQVKKQQTFVEAPFGIIGLESAFSIVYERLVLTNQIDKYRLISLLTSNPAAILQLDSPLIATGKAANLAVIDPNSRWQYDPERGYSKSKNTPFGKRSFKGQVIMTLFHGTPVFQIGQRVEPRLQAKTAKASKPE